MKDSYQNIVNILQAFCPDVIRAYTLADNDELPRKFFVIFEQSSEPLNVVDNIVRSIERTFQISYFSDDDNDLFSTSALACKRLNTDGFIVREYVHDQSSDLVILGGRSFTITSRETV